VSSALQGTGLGKEAEFHAGGLAGEAYNAEDVEHGPENFTD
jgi:hypothetical protein